ncbi:MAG: efflux RND transporter periplasmic adaptor subunit, partial [Candidatus Hydrogenedentes bacterium]|nr:efflux RND transporter periplasmic adaptor subunit [Candidatus Hydrogenedentota bacterium]
DQLERGPRPQEIEAARNELSQAASAIESNQLKIEALRPLLERGEVSRVRYEQVQGDLGAAQASSAAAQSRLDLLRAGTRPEALAEARARVDEAQAELAARELDLERCAVRSPIDGVVSALPARLGTAMDAQTPVATIIDVSDLFVQVRVSSEHIASLDPDRSADVTPSSDASKVLPGALARIAQEADMQTGGTDVFFQVDNRQRLLSPGLPCTAVIWLRPAPGAIVVPYAALSDHDGTPVVTVVRDGKAYEVEVTPGVRAEDKLQILQGVSADDVVVTRGGYGLPEGYPVTSTGDETTNPES